MEYIAFLSTKRKKEEEKSIKGYSKHVTFRQTAKANDRYIVTSVERCPVQNQSPAGPKGRVQSAYVRSTKYGGGRS